MAHPMLSQREYVNTLVKVIEKGEDGFGVISTVVLTALTTIGGMAAAPMVAAALGTTTLLGSSTLASLAGGVFVVSTPVGWVIGTATLCGVLGLGLSRIISKSGKQNAIRSQLKENIIEKIASNKGASYSLDSNEQYKRAAECLLLAHLQKKIPMEKGVLLLAKMYEKKLSPDAVLDSLQKVLSEK